MLATPAGLTFVTAAGTESLYAFQGLVNNHVYALAADPATDHVLAGTLGGLSVLDAEQVRRNLTASNSGAEAQLGDRRRADRAGRVAGGDVRRRAHADVGRRDVYRDRPAGRDAARPGHQSQRAAGDADAHLRGHAGPGHAGVYRGDGALDERDGRAAVAERDGVRGARWRALCGHGERPGAGSGGVRYEGASWCGCCWRRGWRARTPAR